MEGREGRRRGEREAEAEFESASEEVGGPDTRRTKYFPFLLSHFLWRTRGNEIREPY